jgi:hypothetical protein
VNSTEAQIQRDILLAYGRDPRVRLWRSNSGKLPDPKTGRWVQFNFVGCPDISGFLRGGRSFFVEVKSVTGRQSAEQRAFQHICEQWGAVYVLARSVEDVEAALAAQTLSG